LRVTAAVMVVMPISALLGFSGHFNLYFGLILGLAVNVFALWLLYNGLVEALKSKPETTKIVIYVLIAILILFMLIGLGARRRADRFFNNSEYKELLKDIDKK
jgi:hypothetical protein